MTEEQFHTRIREMSPEMRAWLLMSMRELQSDVTADQMLATALPGYAPLDPDAWRPPSLPPGCRTWEEYEARIASV